MAAYDTSVIHRLIGAAIDEGGRGAQTRLADAVGVRVQTVNKWYLGQTSPDPDKWPAIEGHFGWDDGYILKQAMPRRTQTDEVSALREEVAELRRLVEQRLGIPPDAPLSNGEAR